MACYAIGDIQGCYNELQTLLKELDFRPRHDRLWFTGDLVNRGPQSLETLRFVADLGDRAVTVLGNHDLHLLAAARDPRNLRRKDTLHAILDAPDRAELLDWLRAQRLLHHDPELGYTMIHAGLPPQWNLELSARCAREVEQILSGPKANTFLEHMYGDQPEIWSESLAGWDRLRFITNCFTRLRYCDVSGHLALTYKGTPGSQPAGLYPWFEIPQRCSSDLNIVFGHWSTLGHGSDPGIFPLDSGCLWGGHLTALRLSSKPRWYRLPCQGAQKPGNS